VLALLSGASAGGAYVAALMGAGTGATIAFGLAGRKSDVPLAEGD
jgi:hypothetical protein